MRVQNIRSRAAYRKVAWHIRRTKHPRWILHCIFVIKLLTTYPGTSKSRQIMRGLHRLELEELGLSSSEAQVYLALLRSSGGLGASAVANATAIQRTGIYPTLDALLEKGMVERGAGYGSRFTAVGPRRA